MTLSGVITGGDVHYSFFCDDLFTFSEVSANSLIFRVDDENLSNQTAIEKARVYYALSRATPDECARGYTIASRLQAVRAGVLRLGFLGERS